MFCILSAIHGHRGAYSGLYIQSVDLGLAIRNKEFVRGTFLQMAREIMNLSVGRLINISQWRLKGGIWIGATTFLVRELFLSSRMAIWLNSLVLVYIVVCSRWSAV